MEPQKHWLGTTWRHLIVPSICDVTPAYANKINFLIYKFLNHLKFQINIKSIREKFKRIY